jgi:hypothetical protein
MSAGSLRNIWRELAAMPRADLALRLLLVALLFQPVGQSWLRPLFVAVAALGLLSARALQGPALWIALTAMAVARLVSGWPNQDNHAFLLVWWLLAAALATLAGEASRDGILAWNGRKLVGLAFLFATLWKLVLSPDFIDGRFFRVSLVDDSRFEDFTRLAAELDADQLNALRELVREHQDGLFVARPDLPAPPARLFAVADLLTVSTLALEAAVAVAFLAPLAGWVSRTRHLLLAFFCATTYALAPVAGFGWLLLSLGVAQCEQEKARTRLAYLVAFLVVLFATRWPWLDLLHGWVNRS